MLGQRALVVLNILGPDVEGFDELLAYLAILLDKLGHELINHIQYIIGLEIIASAARGARRTKAV